MIILNKLLPLFFIPPGICLMLMVAGSVWKRRVLTWLGVGLLVLFSMPLVGMQLMRAAEWPYRRIPLQSVRSADAIVVLSGMIVRAPGAPLGEWSDAADRFEGGVGLYKAGKAPVLVFTIGDRAEIPGEISEGEMLSKRAQLLGVPRQAIRVTDYGVNTSEESVAVARLLAGGAMGRKHRILLVTSASHMRRAAMLFNRAGFHVEPYPVDIRSATGRSSLLLLVLPDAEALNQSSLAIRELIGVGFYFMKFQLENLAALAGLLPSAPSR